MRGRLHLPLSCKWGAVKRGIAQGLLAGQEGSAVPYWGRWTAQETRLGTISFTALYAALRRLLSELTGERADALNADTALIGLLPSQAHWLGLQRQVYRRFDCALEMDELRALPDLRALAHAIHDELVADHDGHSLTATTSPAIDLHHDLNHLHAEANGGQPYQTVRLFYATDRASGPRRGLVQTYGTRRGDGQLRLGVAEVAIPRHHAYGEIESPKWWQFFSSPDPRKHISVMLAGELPAPEFWGHLRDCVAASSERDVLVLVHGYNVSFDQGLRRAAQIVRDLNFHGAPLLYSWPSHAAVSHYSADEASVEWTVPRLRGLLRELLVDAGADQVHLIAHSMGNRAAVAALRELAPQELPDGAARLSQLVLAAPDIDADTFRQIAHDFATKAQRCTLYANSEDRALAASDWKHGGYPRAGGGGDELVLLPDIDTIDATGHATDFLSHSYFAGAAPVVSDLFYLIRSATPPDHRARLQRQERAGQVYWRIA